MDFDIITAFPGMFAGPLSQSIVKRASDRGLIEVRLHDLREYATDRHRRIDDVPYGGGGGMVLMPGPLFRAVEAIRENHPASPSRTILLCPQGTRYDQAQAQRLSEFRRLILICGHYEGVDERVREHLVDESISIGDYVLTGGEIPAMVLVDSLTRLQPGALGDEEAAARDSFCQDGFDYPHYTRPADFRGLQVPEVLLSGHHENIAAWRKNRALVATARKRPDLLKARTPRKAGATQEH
ncbi:MAG TPA: tRNA (guanosine(37)-N1)-methyltransferase TrmD [Candidatus Polarisedimenticolia bacterium]|jgi:tRNA (guanine37-N1)-methyltransferase|nr:tRNA (guanosine(37)-N1)-methyltransferase TrmD [Candidatus Polarisedimenticolia bacterium]